MELVIAVIELTKEEFEKEKIENKESWNSSGDGIYLIPGLTKIINQLRKKQKSVGWF